MKHLKLFEDFDPFKFMENPESELQKQEVDSEIQEGDYVDTYRGKAQVLSIDGDFSRVQLLGQSKSIVKVPTDMMTKIKRADVKISSNEESLQEIKEIVADARRYNSIIDDEEAVHNIEAVVHFLESALTDILSIYRRDPSISKTPEYDEFLTEAARLVYIVQQNSSEEMQERVQAIVSAFEKIQ